MGRRSIPIERIEKLPSRLVTFKKRRLGFLKKAYELSILCDVDIAVILFSPKGDLTCFEGLRSPIEDVITRFASLDEQERARGQSRKLSVEGGLSRKIENEEMLKQAASKLKQARLTAMPQVERAIPQMEFQGHMQQSLQELAQLTCCVSVYESDIAAISLSPEQFLLMEHYILTQLEIIRNWKMVSGYGYTQLPPTDEFPMFNSTDPSDSLQLRLADDSSRANEQSKSVLQSLPTGLMPSHSLDEIVSAGTGTRRAADDEQLHANARSYDSLAEIVSNGDKAEDAARESDALFELDGLQPLHSMHIDASYQFNQFDDTSGYLESHFLA